MDYIEPHTNLSQLPLEPLSLMVGMYKLTSDTEHTLRFVAHHIEAKELFSSLGILTYHQLKEVAWLEVCILETWNVIHANCRRKIVAVSKDQQQR